MSEESTAGAVSASPAAESASGNTEVAESTQNASESTPEPSNEKPSEKPKKYQVKVDGGVEEASEEELLAAYSKVKAANKRFQEAAEERKMAAQAKAEAEKIKESIKSDPWSVLASLGIDSRKAAEEFLIQQLERDAMSPEQKEAEELRRKLKEYEEKESRSKQEAEDRAKKEQEEAERAEAQKLTEEITKSFEIEFQEALESSKLPRNPKLIAKMAEIMMDAEQEGYSISAKQAAKIVEKDIKMLKQALINDLDPDTLAEFLGEENIKKIRKRDVEKLKNPIPESKQAIKEDKPKKEAPRSPDEWLRDIKKQHGLRN